MRKRVPLLVALIMLVSLLLAACGDTPTNTAVSTTAPAATTAATATTAAAATTAATATTAAAATTAAGTATTAPAATTAAGTATTAPAATTAAGTATTAPAATTAAAAGGAVYNAGGISLPDPRGNDKKAPAGKAGGNLNLASPSDAKSLHPYLTSDATSTDWQNYVWGASLVASDLGTTQPTVNFDVATGLKVSDDKLTYTFTLKDTLKWSDGKPIVAQDYEFTYKNALDPANKWPYVADYTDLIESVTAPDAKTVVFKFKKAEIFAIAKASLNPLPKHVWEGKNWSDPTQNPEIDKPTVVSGVWKLREWKRGQYIIFEKNTAYSIDTPAQLDTVTISIVPTRAAQVAKLKAGELDYVELNATEYQEAKGISTAQVVEYYAAQSSWTYIGFNFRKSYLQDINLRKAMAQATPQKDIVDKLALGLGQAINSPVPASSPLYNPQTPKYDYNIQAATKTLTDAGYKINGGKLTDPKGQAIPKMKIYYNVDNKVREGIATAVQQTYKELGIELEIVPLEFQAYLEYIKKEPFDYDLFILGWRSTTTPETFNQVWKDIPELNSGGWDTQVKKDVLALYDRANAEFDVAKRKEIMGEIQVKTAQDLPYVFVFQVKNLIGVSNKFNISPSTGFGINYNQYADWSVK
jgi:peptide/nickel transport system substrate-binding protein